jgi:hypothetical protein
MRAETKDPARELERAERGVAEVLERIKAGDPKVKPEDLEAAESRVRFARALVEGEERRREEEAERERLERVRAVVERAASELDPAPVEKLGAAAREALSAYVAACVAHNARVEEISSELDLLGPLPEGVEVDHSFSSGPRVTTGGRTVPSVRPMVKVSTMAHEVLREHIRGYIDLERPI